MSLQDEIKQIQGMDEPAELLLSNRYLRELNIQDNELKDMQGKEVSGKAVRIIRQGRIGAAPGGLQTPLSRLLDTAGMLSKFGRDASFQLPEGDGKLQQAEHNDPNVQELDMARSRELAETLIKRLNAELPGWSVGGSITLGEAVNRLATSRGVNQRFQERAAGFWVSATLPREGDLLELVVGRSFFPDASAIDEVVNELVWRARHAETVSELPEGEYPLLLHPEAFSSFIQAFSQAVKGKAIFEGLSPLKDKLGQSIFHDSISILDDPTDKTLSEYTPFGDEGVATKPTMLVENGVLKSYLTDLDYAARLNQPHTGHGSRFPGSLDESIPSGEPGVSSSSWIMPAGTETVSDIMAGMADGVYLLASWDVWSGNLIGGDVSGSTHLAYRIKNGKPIGRIKDMRVSGNIYKWLGEKLLTASQERPITGACSLRVPYYLIDQVKIA